MSTAVEAVEQAQQIEQTPGDSLNAVKAALANAEGRDEGSQHRNHGSQPFVCATVGLRISDLRSVVEQAGLVAELESLKAHNLRRAEMAEKATGAEMVRAETAEAALKSATDEIARLGNELQQALLERDAEHKLGTVIADELAVEKVAHHETREDNDRLLKLTRSVSEIAERNVKEFGLVESDRDAARTERDAMRAALVRVKHGIEDSGWEGPSWAAEWLDEQLGLSAVPAPGAAPWVQCTRYSNACLGGCATRAEHERYNKPALIKSDR